jgi:hypothetical protein
MKPVWLFVLATCHAEVPERVSEPPRSVPEPLHIATSVEVQSEGNAPRKELRLRGQIGARANVDFGASRDIDFAAARLEATIRSVSTEGEMEIEMHDEERSVRFVVGPLGSARGLEVRYTTPGSLEAWSERNTFYSGIVQHLLTAPLVPDRPLGVGARWTVRRTAEWFFVRSHVVTHCELGAIDGERFSITATSEIETPEQSFELPNDPLEFERVVLDMPGTMTQELVYDGVFPVWVGRTHVAMVRRLVERSRGRQRSTTDSLDQETRLSIR